MILIERLLLRYVKQENCIHSITFVKEIVKHLILINIRLNIIDGRISAKEKTL
jgi:hypothetical protein